MEKRAFPFSGLVVLWVALLITCFALLLGASSATAQVISIRSVPISQAHQFELFPSLNRAMGRVSIALADSLRDPLANPAWGSRVRAARIFGSPGVYSVSSQAGGGRTLPVGVLGRSGDWFGGVSIAAQQVDLSRRDQFQLPIPLPIVCPAVACGGGASELNPADRTHGNSYAQALFGREFRDAGLSIGGSVSWAGLHAVDGVDLLYAGNATIRQRGHAVDVRLGAVKALAGDRSVEAVLVHNRLATTHDVFYLDTFWNPATQQFEQRTRLEPNLDHTNIWGLHLEYEQPLSRDGWRLGWAATTNLMSHPKIPNYEIQNIPRDPGNSTAFNLGVGVSRTIDASTFGADLIVEPIWSYTWADAAAPVETASGGTIPAGGKTTENRFRFANATLRMGFGQDIEFDRSTKALGLQVGLMVHRIHYSLDQQDNVELTSRSLVEDWIEWTPTWGLSLRFPAWELRYTGSVVNGTGRPGVVQNFGRLDVASAGTILVAPSGPLTLTPVKVMTHQIAVAFPLR